MSLLQNLTHSKHEESKFKTENINPDSQEFVAAKDFLKLIFGRKLKMSSSFEYSVSFSFKRNKDDILCFACKLKKTESDVADVQLSLFGGISSDDSKITEMKFRGVNNG
ncbi:MAG: hypothetical protein NTV87_12960 [Ignavibacteriae bacterium]|nr:hypothetical protein [Ignavibacteriota bacterium]